MRQMKLGLFLTPSGHHMAAWRHPESRTRFTFDTYREAAETAERGLFDMVFLADVLSMTADTYRQDRIFFDPMTALTALAMTTTKIGLVATVSTSFNEPFNVARRFASLDHLCGGRAGWNIVTSFATAESRLFGQNELLTPAERYERAHEFVDVVKRLWDTWDDDAITIDKQNGLFFDAKKLHPVKHAGKHYKVDGLLNIPRSPQGWPVLVQAGQSEDGRDLASSVAEVIFTIQRDKEEAKSFRADIKARAVKFGRDPAHALVLPGVMPIVGRDRQEARDKEEQIQGLIHSGASVEALVHLFGNIFDSGNIDQPFPEIPAEQLTSSRAVGIMQAAREKGLTPRQACEKFIVSKGHRWVVGTAADIADTLQDWFETGASDGFNIMPAVTASELPVFVDLVIPELQRRGLFRTAYEGATLRDHLGLPRP